MPTARAPRLALGLAACAFPVLCAAIPLGLSTLEHSQTVAAALAPHVGLWSPVPQHFDIWNHVLGRLMLVLPVAEMATRLNLLSALCAAVAIGFWTRMGLGLVTLTRPATLARMTEQSRWHEPVAVTGGVVMLALSRPFFAIATGPGGGGVALILIAAWMLAASALLQNSAAHRAALSLAALAGLVTATCPSLGVLVLPPTLALWLWGLRKSARGALLMPLAFFVGLSPLLGVVLVGRGSQATFVGWWQALTLAPLRQAVASVDGGTWWAAAGDLADQIGVVGGLLAVVGLVVTALRQPGLAAVVLYILWATLILTAGSVTPWALAAFAGIAVVPLVAGMLHFAGKLGRARLPATIALVIIGAVAPLLSGGLTHWHRDGRVAARLLARAQWKILPRSEVDPGSRAMSLAFEYGRALGVRPDLRAPSTKRTQRR